MNNNRYTLLVTNLAKSKDIGIDREFEGDIEETVSFSGVGYFDNHLSTDINDVVSKSEVTIADVFFYKKDKPGKSDGYATFTSGDNWDLLTTQYVAIHLEPETYEKLLASSQANIEINLLANSFDTDNDRFHQIGFEIKKIETSSASGIEESLKRQRIEDVSNFLIKTNCAGAYGGQLVTICREFAESFGDIKSQYKCNELLRKINELIGLIRWTFQSEVDRDSEEFEKYISTLEGRDKRDALTKRANFSKTKSHYDILKSGNDFSLSDVNGVAYDYFELGIKSATLENILLEMLLACQIGEVAGTYQYSGLLSTNAVLNAAGGVYKEEAKSQTAKLVGSIIGWVIGTAFSWWISGVVAGDNDTARIVLFGIFYATSSIYTLAYQNKTNQKETNSEEKYFNLLSRLCHIYSQRLTEDKNLLKHLMYKLEEDGIAFELSIHKLLK
jgi:hypothetical protein